MEGGEPTSDSRGLVGEVEDRYPPMRPAVGPLCHLGRHSVQCAGTLSTRHVCERSLRASPRYEGGPARRVGSRACGGPAAAVRLHGPPRHAGGRADDEAHRSQYDSIDGYAPHMRDARYPTPRSSASLGRPSNWPTPAPAPCSATASASTTSSARSRTKRSCRSTAKAVWRTWLPTRSRGRRSMPASRECRRRGGRPPRDAEGEVGAARSELSARRSASR